MFKNLRNVLKWVAIGTFIHLHTVYDSGDYAIWRNQMAVYIPIIWDMIKYITEIVLVFYILFVGCELDFKKFMLGPLAVDIPLSTPLNEASSIIELTFASMDVIPSIREFMLVIFYLFKLNSQK